MSPLRNKPSGFKVYDELVPWNELDVKLFCGEATGKPMGILTTCQPPRPDGAADADQHTPASVPPSQQE